MAENRVDRVLDGETMILDDGRTIHLASVLTPPSLRQHARSTLSRLVLGRRIEMERGVVDRYRRLVAHVRGEDGQWIQDQVLELGLARVAPEGRFRIPEMLARERQARQAARGLWGYPEYSILSADQGGRYRGQFHILRGTVNRVASTSRTLTLYLGSEADVFLIRLTHRRHAPLPKDEPWSGRLIQVRGWIEWDDDPYLSLEYPELIETIRQD